MIGMGAAVWSPGDWTEWDWAVGPLIIVLALFVSVWAGGRLTVAVLSSAAHSPDSAEGPSIADPTAEPLIQVPGEESSAEVVADGHVGAGFRQLDHKLWSDMPKLGPATG